jgi:hypothetical protein
LRAVWSEGRFSETTSRDKPGAQFDPSVLTSALHSSLFAKYLDLVLEVEGAIHSFLGWCDSCPCHHDLFERARCEHTKVRFETFKTACLNRHFGASACPLAGLRAPGFLCGGLEDLMSKVFETSFSDLLVIPDGMAALTNDEQQIVSEDLSTVRSRIQLGLQTKTAIRETKHAGVSSILLSRESGDDFQAFCKGLRFFPQRLHACTHR